MGLPVDESLQRDLAGVLSGQGHDVVTSLALSGASGPSVVLLRRSGRRVPERARIVLLVLDLVADQLAAGSVVTVDDERVRIRPLPVDR